MSKSISGGLGAVNLNIQELRILNGSFTSLEAVNGTISGTLTVGGLSISGTFSVVNFGSSGLINANDIICNGELTYKSQVLDNRFVKSTTLTTILLDYVTNSSLSTTLADYPTNTSLATTLSNYVLTTTLNTALSDYVLTTALTTALTDYVLTSALNTTLSTYIDLTSSQTISGVKSFTSNTNVEQITLDTGSIFNHSGNAYLGLIGQYTTDIGYNIAFWSDGHVRFVAVGSSGFRFYSRDPEANTTTQIFRVAPGMSSLSTNFTIDGALTIDSTKEVTYKGETLDIRFIQASALTTTLSDYVLASVLTTTLSNYVDKSSAQTIAGVKTFNDNVIIGNPTTNILQVNRIKMDLPLIASSSGNEFPLVLWNKDNANNEKQLGNASFVFYDAFNGTINMPSLKLTTTTTSTTDAYYSILIRDSTGKIITDDKITFNPSQNILKCDSIAVESITLNNLPLNYTQRLHTASYVTSSSVGGVYSFGGNSFYIKPIAATGDGIETYGADLKAVNMTTSGIMSLTSSNYEGVWEIDVSLTFKNDGATRMNPYIEIHKNNAYSNRFSTSAQYCRSAQAMHTTLNIKGFDLVDSTDTYKIVTKITTGTEQNYGTTGVITWTGTNLSISWKYLGELSEHSHSIS